MVLILSHLMFNTSNIHLCAKDIDTKFYLNHFLIIYRSALKLAWYYYGFVL
jgi:hypothetical protein